MMDKAGMTLTRAHPLACTSLLIEWPTLALALLIHLGWMLATVAAASLPWWLVLPVASWLMAWHMSLQHEVIHGHPTPVARLNDLIGSLPLNLWLPYARYKASHLGHHRGELTDPVDDPESQYVTAARYRRSGPLGRALMRGNNTLLGRLSFGPARAILFFLAGELRALVADDRAVRQAWLRHLPGVALVVAWLVLVCHLSLVRYILLFVYPGFSLALLRSFAEHRAADQVSHRTAVVERTPLLGLLFLFNNLHVVHHLRPGLPWYRIPSAYRADRDRLLRDNGGLVYRGYGEVARRYLLRQHHAPVWEEG